MNSRAIASTATMSLPSTSAALIPRLSARAAGPGPAVSASVRVVAANPLSSQTKSTGSRYTAAQLSPSRKGPRFTAPSPKMQTTTRSSPERERRSRIPCAAPAAMRMLAPTTPFAPSIPTPKSAMCIDPPLPPHTPPSRPKSSRIIAPGSAPLARV